jgi:NhaP-type Na+/H+ or K+/H+ antiporter
MESLYRRLLRCYPAAYLHEYGAEMMAVFLQAREDARKKGVAFLLRFDLREVLGILMGALREWLPRHHRGLWRRFDMRREFRFPRSTIFLMLSILVSLSIAISTAAGVAAGGADRPAWMILQIFALCVGAMLIAGVVGYVVLVVLRRTGIDRISSVETWPRQR